MVNTKSVLCYLMIVVFLSCGLPHPDQPMTMEERQSARRKCIAMYTGAGAALGALTGAIIGGGRGAAIGGVSGGALAFAIAWGQCFSHYSDLNSTQVADYEETAQKAGYDPSMGDQIKIENFTITPSQVSQGNSVNLDASYYVMPSAQVSDLKVIETRTVKFFDETKNQFTELGKADEEVTVSPGTRRAVGSTDIPEENPDGRYVIAFKVTTLGKSDEREQEILVKKGLTGAAAQPETVPAATGFKDTSKSPEIRSVKIAAETLNLRQEPNLTSKIVTTVKINEIYPVVEETQSGDKWYKIRVEGIEGWVSGNFVTLEE
jgi:hypothetical protein